MTNQWTGAGAPMHPGSPYQPVPHPGSPYQPVPPYQPAPPYQQFVGQPRPPSPSGATAITAAVLSLFGAFVLVGIAVPLLVTAVGAPIFMWAIDEPASSGITPMTFGMLVVGILLAVATLLLALGGIKIIQRKRAGQPQVVMGSVIAAGFIVVQLVFVGFGVRSVEGFRGFGVFGIVVGVLELILAIATIVLAVVPSTGRWIDHPRS